MMSLMDTPMEFPKYFRNAITIHNRNGYVCIVTFWTKQEEIVKYLWEMSPSNLHKVLSIGNLYTVDGLRYIMMNTHICPQIEYFIYVGHDRNHVWSSLTDIFCGNTSQDDPNMMRFIDYFRVRSYKCESLTDLGPILSNITQRNTLWIPSPIYIENVIPKSDVLPNEHVNFTVRDSSLERLWKRILTKINLFGTIKESDNDNCQKELLCVVSTLTSKGVPFKGMPCADIINEYIPQVASKTVPDGVAYTYGERLFEYDQIKKCINELSQHVYSRRAISTTWRLPLMDDDKNPPCLVVVDFKIQEVHQRNTLYMTCYFRSHDAYNAYCMNVIALQALQEVVVNGINNNTTIDVNSGPITIISNSCHVYSRNIADVKDFHELDCSLDNRGYFTITIDHKTKNINVYHYDDLNRLLHEWSHTSVHTLRDLVQPFTESVSHALYMGDQLRCAKECIRNGTAYIQP